jgi:hypothetical protein
MNCSWCTCSIPFHTGLRNRTYSLRRDLTVFCLIFPLSSVFLQINRLIRVDFATRFTAAFFFGSMVSCQNFLSFCLCFNKTSNQGTSLFRSESAMLLVYSLYAESIVCKVVCRFVGFFPRVNFESRWY